MAQRTSPIDQKLSQNDYRELLDEVLTCVEHARSRAARGINQTLIALYFEIGGLIATRQKQHGWGKSVVERLSADLKRKTNYLRGFSPQNLWLMRQIHLAYRDHSELHELALEVPWGQNVLILQKIKSVEARRYYLRATAQFGWTRNVLLNQIKAGAYEHSLAEGKTHNFPAVLPEYLAEQAEETLKSSYSLEFLGISHEAKEREMEQRLVEQVQDFILELGYGFCFISRQHRLTLGDKEYFVDLLFYHRFLKSLVAFELKTGAFKPEYAGKMDFYLNVLNDRERAEDDNPSIGIILCAEKDSLEVEFALKSKTNPIGVAEYQLRTTLPKELRGKLPTSGQLSEALRLPVKRRGRRHEL